MTCQDFEELSGAYALDAVTPEERQAADEHLAHCAKCTRLLHELQAVVDFLPLSVPTVEPSPTLKPRILSSIQAQKNAPPQLAPPLPMPVAQRPVQAVRPAARRRSSWNTRLLAVAAALMLVLLGGMIAWNISLQQQVSQLSNNQAVTTVNYNIQGTATMPAAKGQLMCFPKQQVCVLQVHGLAQLEGTHVYQGWLLQGKQPTSVGLLNVHDGVATIDFPGGVGGYDATAVSLEPGPVASKDAPRGQLVAVGSLDKPSGI